MFLPISSKPPSAQKRSTPSFVVFVGTEIRVENLERTREPSEESLLLFLFADLDPEDLYESLRGRETDLDRLLICGS